MSGWYNFISSHSMLQQGELLYECPIFVPDPKIDYTQLQSPASVQFQLEYRDLMVMTQSCDIQQASHPDRGDPNMPILLSPVVGLEAVPKEGNLGNLLQDRIGAMHLLKNQEAYQDKPAIEYKIVDFAKVYSLPLALLRNWKINRGIDSPALKSPYAELMSQRFGMKIMRIGTDDVEKVQIADLITAWKVKSSKKEA